MRIDPVVSRFATRGPRRRYGRVRQVAMDKRVVDGFSNYRDDDSECVAQSIRADFSDLVAIFDSQLSGMCEADAKTRLHIVEARSAAARGLLLSSRLIDVLRAS